MNNANYQNLQITFNTQWIGLNRVADKKVTTSLVSSEDGELFNSYTFKVVGFQSEAVMVTVQAFRLDNEFQAIDLVVAALKAGNFEVVNSEEVVNILSKEEEVQLEAVINKAETNNTKTTVKCKRCGGTGKVTIRGKGDVRVCYGCNKGQVPSKWNVICKSAQDLKKSVEKINTQFTDWKNGRNCTCEFDAKYVEQVANEQKEKLQRLVNKVRM